jgi:hypothetical protein
MYKLFVNLDNKLMRYAVVVWFFYIHPASK